MSSFAAQLNKMPPQCYFHADLILRKIRSTLPEDLSVRARRERDDEAATVVAEAAASLLREAEWAVAKGLPHASSVAADATRAAAYADEALRRAVVWTVRPEAFALESMLDWIESGHVDRPFAMVPS